MRRHPRFSTAGRFAEKSCPGQPGEMPAHLRQGLKEPPHCTLHEEWRLFTTAADLLPSLPHSRLSGVHMVSLGLSDFQDNPFPSFFKTLSVQPTPPCSPGNENRRTPCRTVQESVQNVAPVRPTHPARRQTPRNPASFSATGDWHGGCLDCWQCSCFGSKEAGPRGRRHAPSTASDLPAQ